MTCPSGAMNIHNFNSLRSHSSLSDVLCGDAKSSLSSVFNHYHHSECKAWMFILGLPTGSKVLKWSKCNCCSSWNSMTVQATIFRGPWVPRDCVTALSLLPSPPFPKATDGLANLGNGSFSPPVLFSAVLVTVFKDCSLHQNLNYFRAYFRGGLHFSS